MRKKIMFFLFSLSGGGAERTVVNIINNLDQTKFEPLLVLGTDKNNDYYYLLNKNIRVRVLGCTKLRYCTLKLSKCIKQEDPDLLFSTINANNIILLLAKILSFSKVPTIVREANNRTQSGSVTFFNKIITKILYNYFSDKVISLSEGVKNDLIRNFHVREQKINVIYNPIEVDKIQALSKEVVHDFNKNKNEKILVAVGRLVEQKDFKTLIKAFNRVSKEVNVRLVILGKGPKEKELKQLAEDMGIQHKIEFLGFKQNPYKYMRLADVFILSSKWEGFGHVIVEAMSTGTPVISTNCQSGPEEIIKDNKYGILTPVGNDKELSEVTISLLKDKKMQNELRERGRERAKDFDVKKIAHKYEEVFDEVMLNNGRNIKY